MKIYPKYFKGCLKSILRKNDSESFFFILVFHNLKAEEIFPLKKYKFEGIDVWGPNNYDSILKKAYGDNYMELPPYSERKSHYTWVKFNK